MPAISYVILLRGINVNPSTRIVMADLREHIAGLGHSNVRTLLQSGNVIVDSDSPPDAAKLAAVILEKTGVTSPVIVLRVSEFREIVEANPLRDAGDDPSKLVITFLGAAIEPASIDRPSDAELAPERLVITPRAVYQWCPDGILKSRLKPAWWRQFVPVATARNVRTADRILEALAHAKET